MEVRDIRDEGNSVEEVHGNGGEQIKMSRMGNRRRARRGIREN